jgi:hypothetical protein
MNPPYQVPVAYPPHVTVPSMGATSLPSMRDNQMYTQPQRTNDIITTDDATRKLSDRVRRRCFNCCTTDTSTWRRSNLSPGKVVSYPESSYLLRQESSDPIYNSCAISVVCLSEPIPARVRHSFRIGGDLCRRQLAQYGQGHLHHNYPLSRANRCSPLPTTTTTHPLHPWPTYLTREAIIQRPYREFRLGSIRRLHLRCHFLMTPDTTSGVPIDPTQVPLSPAISIVTEILPPHRIHMQDE